MLSLVLADQIITFLFDNDTFFAYYQRHIFAVLFWYSSHIFALLTR